jgi:hypothetical protein
VTPLRQKTKTKKQTSNKKKKKSINSNKNQKNQKNLKKKGERKKSVFKKKKKKNNPSTKNKKNRVKTINLQPVRQPARAGTTSRRPAKPVCRAAASRGNEETCTAAEHGPQQELAAGRSRG